jgi:hypothetical protein
LTDCDDPTFLATLTPTVAPGGQVVYLAPNGGETGPGGATEPVIGQTGESCVQAAGAGTIMGGMMGTVIVAEAAPEIGWTLAAIGLVSFGIGLPIVGLLITAYYFYYDPSCHI